LQALYQKSKTLVYLHKNVYTCIKFSVHYPFLDNLHQVLSKSKDWSSHLRPVLSVGCVFQRRFQDFKLGGALKTIVPSGERRENFWGISCEKSRFYAKKSYWIVLDSATSSTTSGRTPISEWMYPEAKYSVLIPYSHVPLVGKQLHNVTNWKERIDNIMFQKADKYWRTIRMTEIVKQTWKAIDWLLAV
jgi:hypothetical protein